MKWNLVVKRLASIAKVLLANEERELYGVIEFGAFFARKGPSPCTPIAVSFRSRSRVQLGVKTVGV